MSSRSTRRSGATERGRQEVTGGSIRTPQQPRDVTSHPYLPSDAMQETISPSKRGRPTDATVSPAKSSPTANQGAKKHRITRRERTTFLYLLHVDENNASQTAIRVSPRYNTVGDVFVVGTGDCGQLGLGEDVTEKPRPAILHFFNDLNVIDVVAGGMHNLVLTKEGDVYSWGCNDDGALGRVTRKHSEDEMLPGKVQGLEDVCIVRIAAGDSVSVALTDTGNVYAWGTFRSTNGILGLDETLIKTSTLVPKHISPRILHDIIDIAAGTNHVIALSNSGKIFTWGSGEQYQLGRRCSPRDHTLALHPTNVTFLTRAADQRYLHELQHTSADSTPIATPRGSPTRQVQPPRPATGSGPFLGVFAGGYHSFVLSKSYQLWACGLNNYGQTGAGSNEQVQEVFRIGTLSYPITASSTAMQAGPSDHVVHVCAGEQHSLATTAAGRVFVFGRSDSNQLGLPPMASRPVSANKVDSLVEAFAETSIGAYKSVPIEHPTLRNIEKCGAAGQWSAAVDKEGRLYTWGYGDNGQLATGECHDEETPQLIALKSRKVLALGCGGQHMVMLLTKKVDE